MHMTEVEELEFMNCFVNVATVKLIDYNLADWLKDKGAHDLNQVVVKFNLTKKDHLEGYIDGGTAVQQEATADAKEEK